MSILHLSSIKDILIHINFIYDPFINKKLPCHINLEINNFLLSIFRVIFKLNNSWIVRNIIYNSKLYSKWNNFTFKLINITSRWEFIAPNYFFVYCQEALKIIWPWFYITVAFDFVLRVNTFVNEKSKHLIRWILDAANDSSQFLLL